MFMMFYTFNAFNDKITTIVLCEMYWNTIPIELWIQIENPDLQIRNPDLQ